MSWYKRIIAMPISRNLPCPHCNKLLVVDVKQPLTTNKSNPYPVSETGQCMTQCQSCSQWLLMNYEFNLSQSMYADGSLSSISEEEAHSLENSGITKVLSAVI